MLPFFVVVATLGPRGDPIGWPTQWLYFQSSPASKSTTLVKILSQYDLSQTLHGGGKEERRKERRKEGKGKGRPERRKRPLVDLECGPA